MKGILLVILIAVSINFSVYSQNSNTTLKSQTIGPVYLMDTERRELKSTGTHLEYSIYISLPDGYDTGTSKYPVIYITDANQYFGMIDGIARGMQWGNEMPESIIVGIAYPLEQEKTNDEKWGKWLARRAQDFTPTNNPRLDKDFGTDSIKSGGGADFLNFIETDLFPFVESNYRAKKENRTYTGFSLGAFFGLYSMFEKTHLFNRYIIGSPSIWYDDKSIMKLEETYSKGHKDLQVDLFISVGELEEEINAGMVRNMLEFTSKLKSRGYKGLNLKIDMIENGTHMSSPSVSFLNGLKFLSKDK
ncbi:alpha/beta hydrolase [Ulvibacterium marinum]|uniref:Alpha/beta hydrolase n=1 Tax=Ulvibacterium marinum TaxID=2419782 RepID=A0A3B0BQR3_9FLAO|nr:alpha/beta hydrolase-fold protein [Ulvibacterium marinum]RKN75140.1 alpha/beta hydrolase [Ulvibacterium marinum]